MLGENNYTLDIRPTFIDELDVAVRYIEQELRNPIAADSAGHNKGSIGRRVPTPPPHALGN